MFRIRIRKKMRIRNTAFEKFTRMLFSDPKALYNHSAGAIGQQRQRARSGALELKSWRAKARARELDLESQTRERKLER